ncbi:hypothetical protein [Dethiobacter alkaliphilus]|uniref:Yip1 domain-containing protein n=1 Tax=Dethiobacter alkaliphilus AHT 1 TaxID=555088 RepID=C0GKS3_DETAL|nr:hypothetical protein [Dethiobacter alkaliphilus]EEG76095.1 hypothetical protein DealDRAFT_3082 [Dethiobacter alkaliphilus AHT 1]
MNYLQNVIRILTLDTSVYRDMEKNNRLFFTAFVNVFLTGLFFGLARLYYVFYEGGGGFEDPRLQLLYLVGLLISVAQIFLAHAGFSLLLWAMSRGIKGQAAYFPVYLHTGTATVPLWLGLPMVTLYSWGLLGTFSLLLAAVGLTWGFATIAKSLMASQAFTFVRASIALAITIIFIFSFYVLWYGI